jgi:large subunit ribosomal protein L33
MIREIISLVCEQCKRKNYTTTKNRKTKSDKLSLKKFCPFCRVHRAHKESKV